MHFTTIFLALAASVAAQPHHKRQQGHKHAAKHHEARAAAPVIEWVTEYEYTTEVVPVTKTIWVTPGFVPPAQTTSTSSPEYKNTVPAQFYELSQKVSEKTTSTAASSTSVAPPPPPPTSSTTVQPSTVAAPSSQTTQEKAVEQSSQASVQPAPATSVTPAEEPASKAPETTTQAPPQTQAPASVAEPVKTTQAPASSSQGSSGECSSGSACTGDITYYDTGMGACGWTNDGNSENVVALSHLLMGEKSNGNPYCGKSITVKYKGKTVIAKVVDKCMGCEIHAIDLSNIAFESLADKGVGRTQAEWYFN